MSFFFIQLSTFPFNQVYSLVMRQFFGYFIFFVAISVSAVAQPIALRGVLDLRDHKIDNQTEIHLNGEWQFFWQKLGSSGNRLRELPRLIEIPHLWDKDVTLGSNGYGTYKLQILLPKNRPDLAITLPQLYTASNVYVNGQLLTTSGTVGVNEGTHQANWAPSTVPLNIPATIDNIELVIQISNFSHSKGGIREPVSIGAKSFLINKRERSLAYQFLVFGAFITGGFFFLALFYLGKSENAILYFAVFCLCYSLRIITTELYPILIISTSLPFWLTVRLEFLSFYSSAIFFGLYIRNLFPDEVTKDYIRAFTIIFVLFSITTIILPATIFTAFIDYFFGVIVIYTMFLGYSSYKAIANSRSGAIFTFIGLIVLAFIVAIDILTFYDILTVSTLVLLLCYLAFIGFQSLTISNRFVYRFNKAKDKAESASVAKTHFLSTMGHELRTPLNAVIGLSELLLDSKSEKEKTQFARTIKRSGENLLGIINNILDFTKIESDEVKFDYQPTHIPMLLADTIKMLGSLVDAQKVNLSFRFDDSLGKYLVVDPARLQQIIINLVGNAIKFTEEGEISVQVTTTESISEKDQILFIVKDSGIGIPEEKMSLLFDRFSQIDNARSRKYQGTGLGLAISKRLIEAMGGRIWVQSKTDIGTTFYFTLTARAASKFEISKVDSERNHDNVALSKELEILVVEDNLINQKVVIKVLERLGFEADIAVNGFDAIQKVKVKAYDLIFMDMEMPEMDGIEATYRIKMLPDLPKSPLIVAMTANATTEDKARCFEAGMKDFIAKPITLQTTENVLLKWFST